MNFQKIFAVIVLYKTRLEDSITIQTLNAAIEEKISLMVFDNSPERQYNEDNFVFNKFDIAYYHEGSNPGLSYAYNLALEKAFLSNKDWLLLLDQDTTFTKEYIDRIIKLDVSTLPEDVVSVIPTVVSVKDGKEIAPTKMRMGGICKPVKMDSGIITLPISGINSGTLLRVTFMNSINGFNTDYPLDMLDHWYFREIQRRKKDVLLLDSFIKQDLSVFGDFEKNISVTRYKQLLNAESLFIKDEGMVSLLVFKLRLLFRVLKQVNYKNKSYYKTTLKVFFN